jgi:hypothetical protein
MGPKVKVTQAAGDLHLAVKVKKSAAGQLYLVPSTVQHLQSKPQSDLPRIHRALLSFATACQPSNSSPAERTATGHPCCTTNSVRIFELV